MNVLWPSPRDFQEAIQSPQVCFADSILRQSMPAVDRLGLPLVASGGFASVFKLNPKGGGAAKAIRCFRGALGDRELRYRELSTYVEKHPKGPLARFQYAQSGMLVGGTKYPILIMDWVEGSTLDVYIAEVLKGSNPKRHLRHLAEQWLSIVSVLNEGAIAHGDLQHGNILVNNGSCTLVDFDGFFVPALAGLKAIENGHINYQHPGRASVHFDRTLDRFSGLVIYLSLIALERQPDLWADHHDENLLFQRNDFERPAHSPLFQKIKKLDAECQRLAQALESACNEAPERCPYLFDLIDAKSRKTFWNQALLGPVAAPTREAPKKPVSAPPPARTRRPAVGLTIVSPPSAPQVPALQWIQFSLAWMAVWAALASFIPMLQPWASGVSVLFLAGGWPVLSHWRLARRRGARRLTAAWALVAMLAISTPLHWIPGSPQTSSVSAGAPEPVRRAPVLVDKPEPPPPPVHMKSVEPQVAEHLAAAEKLLKQGELTPALLECEQAIVLDPLNDRARWLKDQISKAREQVRGLGH